MKISNKTISFLKNFSTINKSILIEEGNLLATIAVVRNVFAVAQVAEYFPQTIAIYDLNEFLSGLSLFKEPEFDFTNSQYLKIVGSDQSSVKYHYADEEIVRQSAAPPKKEFTLPDEDVKFQLTTDTLSNIIKASSIYGIPDLSVEGDTEHIRLVVKDKKNPTSNSFNKIVGKTDKNFSYNFKIENLKIIPDTYDVAISKTLRSHFKSANYKLDYLIANEPKGKGSN
jgi:hypothetical protein